ncbi:MAG TPA: sigma 54-interacting transcriptional regulator [Pyrinomonadaceae bacterium]|jgi:Nif-specific regulatory protein|nr:sigma 54-interacting transcriptional regulator [Pyrinomonadaceae bacterium]
MTYPRLAVVAGPLQDSAFELGGEEISVGRESSNQISIADALLSRRHCVVRRENSRHKLVDLNSLNGTFVNGKPIREHLLEHGDQISIGESRLVFLGHEGEPAARLSNLVEVSEQHLNAHTTMRMRAQDALSLDPRDESSRLPALAGLARDLTLLVKISTIINSIREPEELQRELLRFVFEVVPAERGAILLVGEEGEPVSEFGLERDADAGGTVKVSRTVVGQVLEEGASVLSNDLFEGSGPVSSESLRVARLSSLLCAPLMLFGRAVGVIYLTATDLATHFDEEHLRLVTIISGLAAVALNNARHVEQLERENDLLREESRVEHGMVGESEAMRKVYQFIARVAPTDSTVLVRGESGTGKELAAQAVHQNSLRAARPFVAINCAALTETLLESELFGHERGAFTGALAQKKGKLEVADGGTLFLDEVGEMSPTMQAKLLRVLQEREFERVGGTRTMRVDVRVVAATNRDLEEAVRAGTFRQDLYYRLNVISFEMPPLRERREDIPLLANYFAAKYAARFKRKVTGLAPGARECLMNYNWPGNVRELENAVERAVVLGSTERVLPEDLPETILEAEPSPGAAPAATKYHDALREAKKQLILRALELSGGSFTEAARSLGVHPNYLHRLIRNLNLRPELKK